MDDMKPYGPLDYILDLGDPATCSAIGGAMPGEAFTVLVYPESDLSAKRILALGTLSPNGQWLIVDVTTPDGQHDSYPLKYQELKRTITICQFR